MILITQTESLTFHPTAEEILGVEQSLLSQVFLGLLVHFYQSGIWIVLQARQQHQQGMAQNLQLCQAELTATNLGISPKTAEKTILI